MTLPQKTTIYFVRHGKIDNPRDILPGRLPRFSLSEEGKQQAQQAATFLSTKPIAVIYSSRMLRTRQTAKYILQKKGNMPFHFSSLLYEVKSSVDGTPYRFLRPEMNIYTSKYNKPGDEQIADIARRMRQFVALIAKRHAGQTIAVVTHGDLIMALMASIEKKPLTLTSIRFPDKAYPRPAAITEVTVLTHKKLRFKRVFHP